MITTNLSVISSVALVVTAGLLMISVGTKKKVLRWKEVARRCPTCGRTDRYNCPCRR